jgi:glycine betaine/proline transport system ATP-binding protein
MRIGDRIAIMEQGRVVQIGTPDEIVTNPANEYVRSFFHGVDVTKVFTGGDLARKDDVSVIDDANADPKSIREQLQRDGHDSAVLVDGSGNVKGVMTEKSLAAASSLTDAFVQGLEPAGSDMSLHDVLSRVANSPAPVPVVDDSGKYMGSVSQTHLLQTLDRTG